jgi:hypothetical protein
MYNTTYISPAKLDAPIIALGSSQYDGASAVIGGLNKCVSLTAPLHSHVEVQGFFMLFSQIFIVITNNRCRELRTWTAPKSRLNATLRTALLRKRFSMPDLRDEYRPVWIICLIEIPKFLDLRPARWELSRPKRSNPLIASNRTK